MLDFLINALSFFGLFVFGFAVLAFILDRSVRSKGWKGPVTDHFDGVRFHNIGGGSVTPRPRNAFLKWIMNRPPNKWQRRENPVSAKPAERVMGKDLVITMVGHASLLIQTEGLNIITDPIWSKRASPISFLGPARYRDPGVLFDDLPPIDIVLISHDHYDHMDIATLRRIAERFGARILVGLGNKEYLKDRGVTGVTEIDWWERQVLKEGVMISSVPAQHFSSRALSDRNKTLWAGYVIETPNGSMYFAGDTGYGPFIPEIAKRYTKFRVAMIPIGAFKPKFFMGPVHVSPDEAFRMAGDLSAEVMIPMHYGTFHLADDGQDEPLEKLDEAIKEGTVKGVVVKVIECGETFRA
jgi:L-ascorbate metabolism protein UlaG (beta-lactamase superfamily)